MGQPPAVPARAALLTDVPAAHTLADRQTVDAMASGLRRAREQHAADDAAGGVWGLTGGRLMHSGTRPEWLDSVGWKNMHGATHSATLALHQQQHRNRQEVRQAVRKQVELPCGCSAGGASRVGQPSWECVWTHARQPCTAPGGSWAWK